MQVEPVGAASGTGAPLPVGGPSPWRAPAAAPVLAAVPDTVIPEPAVGGRSGSVGPPGARRRRDVAEQAAEQAAADLALLRTFGFADPALRPDSAPVVSLASAAEGLPEPEAEGVAQQVRFRATRRDGAPVPHAALTLLDGRGREVSCGRSDPDGRGELRAPQQGSYVLVSIAPGHQPGAVELAVADQPAVVAVLLTRSASVSGAVHGEDGPVAGARVTLVQDGEVVDAVDTDPDGQYRVSDLGAGEYGLSVAAAGCAPVAVLLQVPDETDLRHDVDLEPAVPQAPEPDDDDIVGASPLDGTA